MGDILSHYSIPPYYLTTIMNHVDTCYNGRGPCRQANGGDFLLFLAHLKPDMGVTFDSVTSSLASAADVHK